MKTATLENKLIKIQFPFDWNTVNLVKAIPGRRFISDKFSKHWTCPISAEAVKTLQDAGFKIDPDLQSCLKTSTMTLRDVGEMDAPGLKRELFGYQKQAVGFIEAKKGRAILGDKQGLGKTLEAIAWFHLHPEKKPVVIVCPAHLKLNWEKEIKASLPGKPKTQVIFGRHNAQTTLQGDFIIINYDVLANDYEVIEGKTKEIKYSGWVDYLIDIKPQILVIDEAHYIKENKSQRTKAVKKLAKGIPHRLPITGTLFKSRPIEGWNAIQLVDPTLFPSFWDYTQKYCGAKRNGFGWDFKGASNLEELHEKLKMIMIRRTKQEVFPDLPPKVYSFVPIEIDNPAEYDRAENDFIQYIKETKGEKAAKRVSKAEDLAQIEYLEQVAVKGKMKGAIEWIANFLEDTEDKLIVFAEHKAIVKQLMEKFGKIAVNVDGSVSADKKEAAKDAFQNDPRIKLFVGNIQAAGTGLTLTAASSVAFIELPDTPGDLDQAEDRAYGRVNDLHGANIYFLLAYDTIDERKAKMLDNKRKVLDKALDGKEVDTGSLLSELMQSYQEEK